MNSDGRRREFADGQLERARVIKPLHKKGISLSRPASQASTQHFNLKYRSWESYKPKRPNRSERLEQ
jgi:hypothetical protein